MIIWSERDDPIQLIDRVGEAEDYSKGSDGSDKSIDEDVLEVFAEILFLKIISSCEDHGWKQGIKEYFLIEIYILDFSSDIEGASK